MRSVATMCDRRKVRIEVVSVVHPPIFFALPGAVAVSEYPTQAVLHQLLGQAERHVEHAATVLRDAGFEVATSILEGSAVDQILKRAEAISADLVAVGARGLGPVKRALLGSTSDQVVRHARATLVGRRLTANVSA
jgi:nucleotide-binding universal stress UspA family protein